ncbi:Nif3-like dinuclear metal center hexameric protein [Carboxylicivirga sp. M1479]|uniref:Nif3-like dinuclear metal center hexameric protein n=1 Tax=Carboxylicivirga sp. M1479 TaxID=2594476 RepID=UPI0011777152|nr:Nif3-like dinuclear metal center hexameric protein [Carboxylicivirga sp. M1479]TRX72519.1 Nif3-like dinuclear metal center hexameric protein [Carboxylicivirga sp. M1479]
MQIQDIINELELFAPSALKEDFDNVGLLVGDASHQATGVLITLDLTEAVIDEAIEMECNLIVSHHPIMLSGLKKIIGKNATERMVIKAIQNNIALYASHTNADSVINGVSGKMCEKLGLENCEILSPKKESLLKLVTFAPTEQAEQVREAIFNAGAGHIGNYDACSYNTHGEGTFRAGENANPYVGEKGKIHSEQEVRIETVLPSYLKGRVLSALLKAHPYEEVAYDLYPLANDWHNTGIGMVGDLPDEVDEATFLNRLKNTFKTGCVRYTNLLNKPIKRIALCGGSGSFLLNKAISAKADVFVTGDFKYHQFADAEDRIIIADIGHFESEQYTKEVFFEILTKKFSNFAIHLSKVNTNPVNYL